MSAAVAIFIIKGGYIYLSQRDPRLKTYPLHWQNAGGKIEKDETPIQAAVRELKEETGLIIKEKRFILVGKITINDKNHPAGSYDVTAFKIKLLKEEEPRQTEKDKNGPWIAIRTSDVKNLKPMIPALHVTTKLAFKISKDKK